MVNTGNPSRGCRTCRSRRIKCDERKPVCARCERAKRTCLGYLHNRNASKIDFSEHGPTLFVERASPLTLPRLRCPWSHDQVSALTSDAVTSGLRALQLSTQSKEQRILMHRKYGLVLHQLRKNVLSQADLRALRTPILLLTLYEMIVNVDHADKTWQVHIHAYLVSIKSQPDDGNDEINTSILWPGFNSIEKADLVLDITKLRLRQLDVELGKLTGAKSTPRKLDVKKLRATVKQVYNDLASIPMLLSENQGPADSLRGMDSYSRNRRWYEYHCLSMIALTILIRCDAILVPRTKNSSHESAPARKRNIEQHAEEILKHATADFSARNLCSVLQYDGEVDVILYGELMRSLLYIWPLFCALHLGGLNHVQKGKIKQMLLNVGEKDRLPIAMGMAVGDRGGEVIGDILTGLLVVSSVVEMFWWVCGRTLSAKVVCRFGFHERYVAPCAW